MKKLTHQEMFDRAVLGVVRQGALSEERHTCKYRLKRNGVVLSCGVGHLIAPDLYSRAVEGRPVDEADPEDWHLHKDAAKLGLALAFSGVDITDENTLDLLAGIQTAHDGADHLTEFVRDARLLADRFGLNFPALPA